MDARRSTLPGADAGPADATGRLLGIDLARALAIVGMLAVHVGPTGADGVAGRLYALPHGRASILFVLVAGIGVSLLASSRRRSPARAGRELAWRALVLLPVGLLLQDLDHRVFVILQSYAALFLVAIAALRLPDRPLLFAAVGLGALGPVAYLGGVLSDPSTFDRSPVRFGDGVGGVVHGLVLSGPYPLIVWAAPFLLGMWIGRRRLRSPRTARALAAGGAAAILVAYAGAGLVGAAGSQGWSRLLDATPHSQMPLWLLGSTGSAVLVIGSSLALAAVLPRAVWPAAAAGQLALTVYVAHLLALHAWSDVLRSDAVGRAAAVVAAFAVVAAVTSVAWRAALARGPLEALVRYPWPPREE